MEKVENNIYLEHTFVEAFDLVMAVMEVMEVDLVMMLIKQ